MNSFSPPPSWSKSFKFAFLAGHLFAAINSPPHTPPCHLAFSVNPTQGGIEHWNWTSHFIFLRKGSGKSQIPPFPEP